MIPSNPFTNEELQILQSAVQLWADEPKTEGLTTGLFDTMLDAFDPAFKESSQEQRREKAERKSRERKSKVDAMLELRREESILLMAKLIQLKKSNANQ